MGNSESRIQYFKENNIDPYSILGISKDASKNDIKRAYKKKSLICHPDRTQGKTDLEFKILGECYKFAIDTLESMSTKSHQELRTNYNRSAEEEFEYEDERNVFKINWEDPKNRTKFFANGDQLPFDKMESIIKEKERSPTDYASIERKNYRDIFDGKAFNNATFNAAFEMQTNTKEKLKASYTGDPQAFESFTTLSPLHIETFGGLIVEKRINDKPISFTEDTIEPELISNMKQRQLTAVINKTKKETVGMSKRKTSSLVNNMISERANVKVDTSRSFADRQAELYETHMNTMREEMDSNRVNVMNNLSIYPQNVIRDFQSGLLDDSSSVVFANNLMRPPKGIRRK